MKKLIRNTATPETAKFWESALRSAEEVENWPKWKKGWESSAPATAQTTVQTSPSKESGSTS